MNQKIVVFAPHPDDESAGCGGLIAKRISQGYDALIVVMTDGRHAFSESLGIHSDPSPEELKTIRKEEIRRAMKILGLPEENLIFLDFEDGRLRENAEKAEELVAQILEKNRPEEVYFPAENDHHKDHKATNRIVKNSIGKLGLPAMKYQYVISQRFSRIGPIFDRIIDPFKHTIFVDVSEFVSLKEEALKAYVSEISIISKTQKRPIVEKYERYLQCKEEFYFEK
jgi:LmbE family N-acetylglucosaminyl deacetylase